MSRGRIENGSLDPPPSRVERGAGGPAIRARGLARSFRAGLLAKRRVALRALDLDVPRGSTLGLVGPNGSGKSTFLRLAAGVDRPTSGELLVEGADPRSREAKRRTAYLPEDSPFPGELSARAALGLLAALSGLPRRDSQRRAALVLERAGLAEHARVPLRAYSRGMLRRFGLAQAFLADPDVVLLDEPTAGLDALGFAVLDAWLGEARARGATTVLASHVLSDVHAHCDRLAVLAGGRLMAEGTPAALLGVEGRVRVELAGASDALLADLEGWAAARGAAVLSRAPSGRSLLDLYAAAAPAPARAAAGGGGDGG